MSEAIVPLSASSLFLSEIFAESASAALFAKNRPNPTPDLFP